MKACSQCHLATSSSQTCVLTASFALAGLLLCGQSLEAAEPQPQHVHVKQRAADEARADDLQEGLYHLVENPKTGLGLQSDVIFDFAVDPVFLVLSNYGTPVGAGVHFGPIAVFTWTTPENGTDLFVGLGDRDGLEYFGLYLSLDGSPSNGIFTMARSF